MAPNEANMRLYARELDLAPDVVQIASKLARREGFSCLWPSDSASAAYLACDPVEQVASLDPEPSLPLAPSSSTLAGVPRWFGLLPYEAQRTLERQQFAPVEQRAEPHLMEPRWLRYSAVVRVSDRVAVIGDDARQVHALGRLLEQPSAVLAPAQIGPAQPFEADAVHAARICRVLELIRQGEVYQVNVARRLEFAVDGTAFAALLAMLRRAPAPYAAAFEWDGLGVASTSPELFLHLAADGRVITVPIKGTRPRGTDAIADRALADELSSDEKERAELTMVVDIERNDLSRVARRDSVRVLGSPELCRHKTVWHRQATVAAWLAPGIGRAELLRAMLPSGSITGAPKVRAMEVIAELEAHRRGLYTGAFGVLRHDGSLELAMAIRTMTLRAGRGHYFVGGGIVADSDPGREVEETRWKAQQIMALLSESEAAKLGPGAPRAG